MSAAINTKRLWAAPDRPLSADPARGQSGGTRPPFSSFSSFSSSISSSISSAFGAGRHSRSGSNASNTTAPQRPSSAAPQTKWIPRASTPGQQPSSRHRSTSSASAAAAALQPSSAEPPLPPLPDAHAYHRGSPAPPGEAAAAADGPDAWRLGIQHAAQSRYRHRVRAAEQELRERLRTTLASGGLNSATVSRRRDSLSSGSSGSSERENRTRASEEARLRAQYERTVATLRSEMEEEVRAALRRGVPPPANPSAPMLAPLNSRRGVVVEDENENEGEGEGEEWTWRPEEHGERAPEKEKWKDAVRQEQQVIWDAIKRGGTPPASSQQGSLSTSASRKVHFASASASTPPDSTPSAPPLSATQTQPPSLPRTPHTAPAHPHTRSVSAHPNSAARSMSPQVAATAAAGMRPGSARPASPAYTRWIPSAAGTTAAPSSLGPNGAPGAAPRTASNPIAIPGRGSGHVAGEGNGSAGRERTGSVTGSGSWRDWSVPPTGHAHAAGVRRDAPTPSPTATNNSSHHGHGHGGRMPSNGSLHSSVYASAARQPSTGNLQYARTPSNGNLQNGAGMRRALTPGAVSSASGYARQRTASVGGRAPSVPPVLPSAREREGRERDYGREYTSMRERERERRARESGKGKAGVVDDREPDDGSPPHAHIQSQGRMKAVQATAGLGSRQSSTRSALVDEDAPPPEAFHSSPAPQRTSSKHAAPHDEDADEDEEEEVPAPRRDKGKGKARAPPSPMLVSREGRRGSAGGGGMFGAQLQDFAMELRRDLGISAEA